jgi:hypothetical protein
MSSFSMYPCRLLTYIPSTRKECLWDRTAPGSTVTTTLFVVRIAGKPRKSRGIVPLRVIDLACAISLVSIPSHLLTPPLVYVFPLSPPSRGRRSRFCRCSHSSSSFTLPCLVRFDITHVSRYGLFSRLTTPLITGHRRRAPSCLEHVFVGPFLCL